MPLPNSNVEFDNAVSEKDGPDFRRYMSLFVSNWYWFAIALFISLSIAYGINRWAEEIFTVSSTILIKSDQNPNLSDIFPGSGMYRSQQNVNNEIGILKSYDLNLQVMRELPGFYVNYIAVGKRGIAETRLYNESPFIVEYDSLENQPRGKVMVEIVSQEKAIIELDGYKNFQQEVKFGEEFRRMGYSFSLRLRDSLNFIFDPGLSNKYYFYFETPSSLANIYRSKLSVSPVTDDASLLILSTTGPVAMQEIDYLNTLMRVYLYYGLQNKNRTAAQTIEFIEDQLKSISDSLKKAENELERFRLNNNLMDISREGIMIQGKFEKVDAEISALLLQKSYYSYLKEYIETKRGAMDIVAPSALGLSDPSLTKLIDDLKQLQEAERSLSMNLSDNLGPVKLTRENINITRSALNENVNNALKNIESSLDTAHKKLRAAENEIRRLPSTDRELINIQRKYDLNNTVYTFLLEKRAEAGIQKAANVSDNRIIDYAGGYSTARIRPRESNNMVIAIVIGLLLPLMGIVIIDFLNNKIIDKRDIERGTLAPLIGYISHNTAHSEMPVAENPGSTIAESFRSIRTSLKYFIKDNEKPVISVSSTITGEGKTFISANLASIFALSGRKVLLVGLDLRKPRIHRLFNIGNDTGLTNYLIGQEDYENVIFKTAVDNLWYAASGPVPPNPAELIDSPEMLRFIERSKKEFDYIIIDTPPVAIVTDALLCSSFTDFYIFVVRQRYSSKNTLGLVEELNRNENLKKIGLIINDISLSGYYGYGLRYGYSLGYGYTYGYSYYGAYSDHLYGYKGSNGKYYTE